VLFTDFGGGGTADAEQVRECGLFALLVFKVYKLVFETQFDRTPPSPLLPPLKSSWCMSWAATVYYRDSSRRAPNFSRTRVYS